MSISLLPSEVPGSWGIIPDHIYTYCLIFACSPFYHIPCFSASISCLWGRGCFCWKPEGREVLRRRLTMETQEYLGMEGWGHCWWHSSVPMGILTDLGVAVRIAQEIHKVRLWGLLKYAKWGSWAVSPLHFLCLTLLILWGQVEVLDTCQLLLISLLAQFLSLYLGG